jgi:acetylornithine deacetylase/succinyl-diaminopimelate desuccinylase-like protein
MNDTLQLSCQWGNTPDGGMSECFTLAPIPQGEELITDRLTLNDDDAKVRRWFISEVEKLGCKVTVDAIGNIFAVYPGRTQGPPIAMGSHLDTQPTGGRYDGILGVLAGLEVLRAIKETGYEPHHPLAVVCWTDEEGARFLPAMLGSGVWAEHHSVEFG